MAKSLVNKNAFTAFLANKRAYELYPFDHHIRHQYYVVLYKLMQRPLVYIDNKAADKMYEIAVSAGRHPATLVMRAIYLVNSGRPGADELVEELKQNAKLQDATWAMAYILEKDRENTANLSADPDPH